MSKTSLKETFASVSINDQLILEEGILDEEFSSIIKQIIDNQLKKFHKKGKYELSKKTLGILKKLNKLGVKKMFDTDLDKAIPAIERELTDGDDDERSMDLMSFMKNLSGQPSQNSKGKRYPIMRGGRPIAWRTRKEHMKQSKYSLKALFLESDDIESSAGGIVENEQETRYGVQTTDSAEVDYQSKLNIASSNNIPETPHGDDADDREEVSKTDVVSALTQDNARYGEFDEALED